MEVDPLKVQRKVVILGATGSIGTSALRVINEHREILRLSLVVAHSNKEKIQKILKNFPEAEGILIKEKGWDTVFEWLRSNEWDILLNAVPGGNGLTPSFYMLSSYEFKDRMLALANKETLVAAGNLFMKKARENRITVLPIDSEHSSLFILLSGIRKSEVKKIFLTASGGALFDHPEPLEATPEEALRHPTWKMGPKITIDSATLINKAFEVAEAHHLFNLPFEKIDVLIHRESQVHAIVTTQSGAVHMLSFPTDMAYPIAWALTYPEMLPPYPFSEKELIPEKLTFQEVPLDKFPLYELALKIIKKSQPHGAALVGLNDRLVRDFLDRKIKLRDFIKHLQSLLLKEENELIESTQTRDPDNWLTYHELITLWREKEIC